jgi:5'-3' exonuclease
MHNRYKEILGEIKKHVNVHKEKRLNDHVLIIDGLNNFIRTWAASPATNSDGQHIGGIVGFLQTIALAIRTLGPTRTIIVFDGKGGSVRRKKLYPDYKAGRKPLKRPNRVEGLTEENEAENMRRQFRRLVEYLNYLPITFMAIENIEADDAIAYIGNQILRNSRITIMSTDKDFYQMINDRISIWSPTKKILYDRKRIEEEFEILPENFIYYRIIDGDKSDNIGGVRGLGLKTIRKKFPFLKDQVIYTFDEFLNVSNYVEHKELLERNYRLMQLKEVDIPGNAKLSIQELVHNGSGRLVKYKIHKMFLEDTIEHAIRNPDVWLQNSFNQLELILQNVPNK